MNYVTSKDTTMSRLRLSCLEIQLGIRPFSCKMSCAVHSRMGKLVLSTSLSCGKICKIPLNCGTHCRICDLSQQGNIINIE